MKWSYVTSEVRAPNYHALLPSSLGTQSPGSEEAQAGCGETPVGRTKAPAPSPVEPADNGQHRLASHMSEES